MIEVSFLMKILTVGLISALASLIGSLMLGRKMSLVAGPLGHLALPGAAVSLILGIDVFWGALALVLLGSLVIWYLAERTLIPIEALTALVFASGLALAFLFLSEEHLHEALFGNVLSLKFEDLILTLVFSAIVLALTLPNIKKLVFSALDESLAKAEGIKVGFLNLIYLLAIALAVALSTKIVGGLLTVALIAIPSATAKILAHSLKQYLIFSVSLGFFNSTLGSILSLWLNLSSTSLIILTFSLIFMMVFILSPKHLKPA